MEDRLIVITISKTNRSSLLTQMLCHVCTRADAGASWKTILSENLNLKRWWAEHQEEDKRRLQAEQRDAKIKKAKASAYDKCVGALEFHHKEPSIKKYVISSIWHYNIDVLEAELDKCIMICANCHREIHEEQSSS